MFWKVGVFLGLGVLLLLVGLSCMDESPTRSGPEPVHFVLTPGTQWTFQYVIDDSARCWSIQVRDEQVEILGETAWALDYFADGVLTQTEYYTQEGATVSYAGSRSVSWEDTLVTVITPPLQFSPAATGPGERWSTVASATYLKITPSTPTPDTLVTEGYLTLEGKVLGEDRIEVPAFGDPVDALWVELYGETDPWSPPEIHSYIWFAENVGFVRTINLTFGGRTVNDLSEFVQGK